MFEKVNPSHPDKLADRIAGAIVDLAYLKNPRPKIAVEVLLGHGDVHIIAETSVSFTEDEVQRIVNRIVLETVNVDYKEVRQDPILSGNQAERIRCGDNGIFKGSPVSGEQDTLTEIAKRIYEKIGTDGKYIMDGKRLIICQSHADREDVIPCISGAGWYKSIEVNPLGHWTGGPGVDAGATNRKLGSDMGDGVTGGGLHGKDLSKADVTLNICAHLEAQRTGKPVTICCAIGDDMINGKPYAMYVEEAREYISKKGGFEKFAEWGLI